MDLGPTKKIKTKKKITAKTEDTENSDKNLAPILVLKMKWHQIKIFSHYYSVVLSYIYKLMEESLVLLFEICPLMHT